MVKKQLLFALRRLGTHKLNTTINILGLTLGVLACLVIFLFVSFEFSYDKFHPNRDRIYRVNVTFASENGTSGRGASVTPPLGTDLRREATGADAISGLYVTDSKVQVPTAPGKAPREFAAIEEGQHKHITFAEPQWLDIFHYDWLAGNPKTALNEPFSVVLTEPEARRYFDGGDPQSWLGRTLVYHDSLTVSVTGIVADWKENSDVRFTDLISYSTIDHSFLKKNIDGWNFWDYDAQAYVLLPQGKTPAQFEKQLPAFVARHQDVHPGQKPPKIALSLQPLSAMHLNTEITDAYGRRAHKPTLYALAGIALFILIIASINFINLSTAQAVQRAKEVGVRKVLGSSRAGLTGQFLIETGIIVVAAMSLALLLANPVIHALSGFIPAGVGLDITSPLTIGFIVGTIVLTCLLAGWYPARVLSGFLPVISLRGQGIQSLNSRSGLRKALIVFQFTISLLFIIATLVVGRQMHYMLNNDLGFNKDAILNIELPWNQPRNRKSVIAAEIARLSGVEQVSLSSNTPAANGHNGTFVEHVGGTNARIEGGCDLVDIHYLHLYAIPLVAGRNFTINDTSRRPTPADSNGFRAFIINETAATALGFKHPADAVGQLIKTGFGGTVGPVLGVVKDYHSVNYHTAISPFFFTIQNGAGQTLNVKLGSAYRTPAQAKELIARMETTFNSIYPESKFKAKFFDETLQQMYEKEQKTASIMNLSMAVAIFISCMGLFGLAAFTASQRTREIGIRKVLGARIRDIVGLLAWQFSKPVIIANLIAWPVAYLVMYNWLHTFDTRIDMGVMPFIGAGLLALVIAIGTIASHAIRVARANPILALRYE